MTRGEHRQLGRLVKQLHAFLDAVEAPDGLAVMALIAAASERGEFVISRGQDPEANRTRLLQSARVMETAFKAAMASPEKAVLVAQPTRSM